ncbi:MAG: hypothetical protein RL199_1677 [Pseudomonadota bacterium]|jgi:hypothetical protein
MRPAIRSRSLGAIVLGLLLPLLPACSGCDTGALTSSAGRLVFEPDPADFGAVVVGQQKELKVGVTNAGRAAIKVRAIELELADGLSADDFVVRFTPSRMDVGPGEEQFVTLLFTPKTVGPNGAALGKLLFREEGVDQATELVLSGRGFQPKLAFEPSPLTFGPVVVDETSEQALKLHNLSEGPVEVDFAALSGAAPAAFEVQANGRAPSRIALAAGESASFSAKFLPRTVGELSALLRARPCANEGNPSCAWTDLTLSGEGLAAGLKPTPSVLDFGAVMPGRSLTKSVHFQNVGTRPVTMTGIVAATQGTPFEVIRPVAWPSFAPGEEHDVEFTFSPTEMGGRRVDMVVSTDDPRTPSFRLPLRGSGGGPVLAVAPEVVAFNDVALGHPVTRRVTLVNKGLSDADPAFTGDDLVIDGLELAPGEFALGPVTLPIRIAPGKKAVVEVSYSPNELGPDEARLVVRSNDAEHPSVEVPVVGNGVEAVPCDWQLLPDETVGLQFGSVSKGRTKTLSFSLQNLSATPCLVGSVETDPLDEVFRLAGEPVVGRWLAPSERLPVEVVFEPKGDSDASYTGKVDIAVVSTTAPVRQLPLAGRGAEVCLTVSPAGVDFGVVEPKCSTGERKFTVYNACEETVSVDAIEVQSPTSEFTVLKLPSFPQTLAPGEKVVFSARYRANDEGPDVATVEVSARPSGSPADAGEKYVVSLAGNGVVGGQMEEVFAQADNAKADILFVVDDSGSMAEWQEKLADNFAAFMTFAQQQGIDYRIAVTTTGTFAGCSPEPFLGGEEANGRFAPWSVDSPTRIVDTSMTDSFVTFASNVAVGTDGCPTEMGLEGAYLALSDPNINAFNAGFLRNDASLAVIIVSDAPDQSPRAVDFYVDFFQNLKGARGSNMVSVSAIAWDETTCGAESSDDQSTPVYREVARRTGGIFALLCSDWNYSLQQLGQSAFGKKSRFFLTSEPVPSSLVVTVTKPGGVPREYVRGESEADGMDYWYDPDTNAVVFAPLSVPKEGSRIDVSYAVACY